MIFCGAYTNGANASVYAVLCTQLDLQKNNNNKIKKRYAIYQVIRCGLLKAKNVRRIILFSVVEFDIYITVRSMTKGNM